MQIPFRFYICFFTFRFLHSITISEIGLLKHDHVLSGYCPGPCSRKRFSEREAEQWWAENRVRVHEQYNVRGGIDRVSNSNAASGVPAGGRQGEDGRPFSHSPYMPVTY